MQKGIIVVAAAMGSSVLLWMWLSRFLPKMPYFSRLIITATTGNRPTASASGPVAGNTVPWPPVGAVGKALTELRPGGSAEFYDPAIADKRITSVVSETGFLPAGSELVVRALAGPSIIVRKKE
jgi:membrane-bound ClpP family serine protease